jgi:beta-aspartyl-peptidase (threonine type)
MTPQLEREYREALSQSLRSGHEALMRGAGADAVVAAIRVMEDSPLFNAGRGSNFDAYGAITMDASLMVGEGRMAGAVAGVTDVRHPIELARLVMERSAHVMLHGSGAEAFARANGVPWTPPSFFRTERRWEMLREAKKREAASSSEGAGGEGTVSHGATPSSDGERLDRTFLAQDGASGTVGAVSLDRNGELVAGTSTGGSVNKRWGRIGDSPIIGAGTYASSHCAVSCTGLGEAFIRHGVARDLCARMEYLGESLAAAADELVLEVLAAEEATGGIVAVDRHGTVHMPFNTEGMYRGYVGEDGEPRVAIYRDPLAPLGL